MLYWQCRWQTRGVPKKNTVSTLQRPRASHVLGGCQRRRTRGDGLDPIKVGIESFQTTVVEKLVVAEDALCAECGEMAARFATLERESVKDFRNGRHR